MSLLDLNVAKTWFSVAPFSIAFIKESVCARAAKQEMLRSKVVIVIIFIYKLFEKVLVSAKNLSTNMRRSTMRDWYFSLNSFIDPIIALLAQSLVHAIIVRTSFNPLKSVTECCSFVVSEPKCL